jgi:hypothetical protein
MSIISRFLVIVLLVFAVLPVHAQEEEQALLDRIIEATESIADYETFVIDEALFGKATITTKNRDPFHDFMEDAFYHDVQQTTRYILGDNLNIHTEYHIEITEYTLTGEVRFVEGNLYLISEPELKDAGNKAQLEALPEGWVQVEDAKGWPVGFGYLNLKSFLQESYTWELFDQPYTDNLFETPSEVVLETDTLDDGTPVDIITVTLTGDILVSVLGGDLELADWDSTSIVTITIILNENDQIIHYVYSSNIIGEMESTGGILSSGPTLEIEETVSISFSQVNEPLELVEAPEI